MWRSAGIGHAGKQRSAFRGSVIIAAATPTLPAAAQHQLHSQSEDGSWGTGRRSRRRQWPAYLPRHVLRSLIYFVLWPQPGSRVNHSQRAPKGYLSRGINQPTTCVCENWNFPKYLLATFRGCYAQFIRYARLFDLFTRSRGCAFLGCWRGGVCYGILKNRRTLELKLLDNSIADVR